MTLRRERLPTNFDANRPVRPTLIPKLPSSSPDEPGHSVRTSSSAGSFARPINLVPPGNLDRNFSATGFSSDGLVPRSKHIENRSPPISLRSISTEKKHGLDAWARRCSACRSACPCPTEPSKYDPIPRKKLLSPWSPPLGRTDSANQGQPPIRRATIKAKGRLRKLFAHAPLLEARRDESERANLPKSAKLLAKTKTGPQSPWLPPSSDPVRSTGRAQTAKELDHTLCRAHMQKKSQGPLTFSQRSMTDLARNPGTGESGRHVFSPERDHGTADTAECRPQRPRSGGSNR